MANVSLKFENYRGSTLVADIRNLTSKYWKLLRVICPVPLIKVKVFMCYPRNILNSEGIVVCSMCFAQNKENWGSKAVGMQSWQSPLNNSSEAAR